MKDTIEKLIRKNEKLKCKLNNVHRARVTTVISAATFVAVGFIVELFFDKIKEFCNGGG